MNNYIYWVAIYLVFSLIYAQTFKKAKSENAWNFADGLEQRYGVESLNSREKTLFRFFMVSLLSFTIFELSIRFFMLIKEAVELSSNTNIDKPSP